MEGSEKAARPGVKERPRQITQSPGGGGGEPGFPSSGVGLWEGFKLRETSRVLPPQAGYPAPGRHVAEELQENCECPEWGEVWKPLDV